RLGREAEAIRARAASRTAMVRPRHYWAYNANPAIYRIQEAIHATPIDLWTTKGRDMRVGDRVLFWQTLGRRGTQRGIVALGEVLSDPEMLNDDANPFWAEGHAGGGVGLRVRVRYVVPPGLPLWYGGHATPSLHA